MRIQAVIGIGMAIAPLFGQSYQRHATITGSGSLDQGKCTIEVVVDGSAEVQLRGTTGVLRNLSGQAPQWRRFECTGAMPTNPTNFKFTGVDGRGQQQLVRDPRETGVAVIRIDDRSGGSEGYTFDVEWQGYTADSGPFGNTPVGPTEGPFGRDEPLGRQGAGRRDTAITSAEAVETCQQEITRQAQQRFGTSNLYFRRTAVQNNRGGQDRIQGTIDVNTGTPQRFRFNCSVNLNNGRVRSAQIENAQVQQNTRDYGYRGGVYDQAGVTNSSRAIQNCENAVDQRLASQGYQRVGFGAIDIDERTGTSDRVFGSVTVRDNAQRQQTIDFTCTVNFTTGTVGEVNVIPRRIR